MKRTQNTLWLLLVLVGMGLSGCSSVRYYTQAARGHLDMMSKRVPVEQLLNSSATEASLKAKLEMTQEARDFAVEHLSLPDNDSYRSYADLGRPYVLWNVFATGEFSIEAEQWCYLFVGCLGYRGYFSKAQAEAVASGLRDAHYDVMVGGVPAYSTLGRFADPLLNTMLYREEIYVVELMFHELTHQRVYRAGDSEFSESLASFVQQEGVFRWLAHREDDAGLRAYQQATDREQQFVGLLVNTRDQLGELFRQELPIEQMRTRKLELYQQLTNNYERLRAGWGGYMGYDAWFARDLNNADLVAISTYHRLIPAFRQVLKSANNDMTRFFELCAELSVLTDTQLDQRLNELLVAAETSK